MVLKKSSLIDRREFFISCQSCPRIFRLTPHDVEHSDRLIKIFGMKGLYIYQCECGTRFNVQLDFRQNTRHDSEIGSFYTTLTKDNYVKRLGSEHRRPFETHLNCVIKNISVGGIGFVTNDEHDINPTDKLLVKLIINRGGKDRLIERRVIVRTVSDKYIGAEFFAEDKKDPEIGFYLMPD